MIPYFQWTNIPLGPIHIQVWGLMVALGIIAALLFSIRIATIQQLNTEHIIDMAFWIVLSSMLGSRCIYVISEYSYFASAPIDIVKIWQGGMSISGGLLGALVAFFLYVRKHKLSFLKYADVLIFGLPLGLWIGRLGCFFIFDHPGSPTHFFLGQQYIDGIVRHNHGLYLSIDGLMLFLLFLWLRKRKAQRKTGFYMMVFLLWDGIVRFCLDFFRATDLPVSDSRYSGLTVAQWLSVCMVAAGVYLWYRLYSDKHNHAT